MDSSYCFYCDAITESEYDKFPDVIFYNENTFDVHVTFCVECKKIKSEESWFE